ncbi:MAG: hypothetical protein LBQ46_12455 [Treponema sp.]|jgi:hypothetical protein|nr:hypothetical protein [Treponema sp.]
MAERIPEKKLYENDRIFQYIMNQGRFSSGEDRERGAMTRGDLANVLDLTEILHEELYKPYTRVVQKPQFLNNFR